MAVRNTLKVSLVEPLLYVEAVSTEDGKHLYCTSARD